MIKLTKDTNYFKMKLQHIHALKETLASNKIRISQHLSKSYQICAKTPQACTPCNLGIKNTLFSISCSLVKDPKQPKTQPQIQVPYLHKTNPLHAYHCSLCL